MRLIVLYSLCFFLFSSCNSYLSIEKRKYRDGYHVEWFSKAQKIQQDTIKKCDSAPPFISRVAIKEMISRPMENLSISSQNISFEKQNIKDIRTMYRDLAPEIETKFIKKKHKQAEESDHTIYIFIALLLIAGCVMMLVFSSPLWFVLSGLLALIIAMLSIVGAESAPKVNIKEETLEEKLSIKKRIPFITFLAVLLALMTLASYFLFYGVITIFTSILGAAFSADSIYKIKRDRAHKKGMGISIACFVINIASLVFLAYIFLMYLLSIK